MQPQHLVAKAINSVPITLTMMAMPPQGQQVMIVVMWHAVVATMVQQAP